MKLHVNNRFMFSSQFMFSPLSSFNSNSLLSYNHRTSLAALGPRLKIQTAPLLEPEPALSK